MSLESARLVAIGSPDPLEVAAVMAAQAHSLTPEFRP
jgi:hypothetical protein